MAAVEAAWKLGPDGFGPVRLGMTLEEATTALGVEIKPELYTDSPDLCDLAVPTGDVFEGLSFLTLNNRISNVRLFARDGVSPSPIVTINGVGLGSSESDVRGALGENIEQQVQPYSGGNAIDLYYWRDHDHGIRYQLSRSGQVWAIHAGARSITFWEGCL